MNSVHGESADGNANNSAIFRRGRTEIKSKWNFEGKAPRWAWERAMWQEYTQIKFIALRNLFTQKTFAGTFQAREKAR